MTEPERIAAGLTEEKALENALAGDEEHLAYMTAFKEAREAFYQRGEDAISECDARCVSVLKKHFQLRAILERQADT